MALSKAKMIGVIEDALDHCEYMHGVLTERNRPEDEIARRISFDMVTYMREMAREAKEGGYE